jgi:hypothetical protein
MTSPAQESSIVALFDSHSGAEAAINALQQAGVDMRRLSIVAKDFQVENHVVGFYTASERMNFWGGRGVFWGTLWDMLFGWAFFLVPAVGPIIVMGPLVGRIAGVLEGTVPGGTTGLLAAALTNSGIPKESVLKYERDVKAGKYLVQAYGSAEMVELARRVLARSGPAQLAPHHAMHAATLAALHIRESILELLSDEEVARVSAAETATGLVDGDEYLDLERLDQGVRHAQGSSVAMGSVLPKKAVHDQTWRKILAELPAVHNPKEVAGSKGERAPRLTTG